MPSTPKNEGGPTRRPGAWRRTLRGVQRTALRPTAAWRVKPGFLVLGAQKAGTTSIHAWIETHPSVVPARAKEVHFFDRHHHRGEGWYRTFFPLASTMRRRGGDSQTGEATPAYLFHPDAPRRAQELVPAARLIVVLRDPVDRAVAHWRHETRAGRETRDLPVAIEDELERLDTGERPDPLDPSFSRRWYVSRGLYGTQLGAWRRHFGADQLAVLFTEELAQPGARQRLLDHLGLSSRVGDESIPIRNSALGPASPLDPGLRRQMRAVFAADGDLLEEVLGRSVPWA